jgi:CheY-like chemotaxis protein
LTGVSVLIVEDEKLASRLVQETLNRLGYRVAGIAASGEEAVVKAGELRPSLILMDIVLAGSMDGIQAAAAIGSQHGIPVVFMTAQAEDRYFRRAMETLPYGFVYKPVKDRELKVALEVALARRSLERRLLDAPLWLGATLRCISEVLVAIDPQGKIRFMTVTAEALCGIPQEQAQGGDLLKVFPLHDPQSGRPCGPFWERYFKEDWAGSGYLRFHLAREGGELVLGCSVTPVKDDDQKPIGAVMVFKVLPGPVHPG